MIINYCYWCDKEITTTPIHYDLDLDTHYHHECAVKDLEIDKLIAFGLTNNS